MYDTDNNVIIDGVVSEVTNNALNGAITNSATSIVCDDVSAFPDPGGGTPIAYVKIDQEIITYTGKTSTTTLTGCVRGVADGTGVATTAASHEDNSVIELYMFAVPSTGNGGIPLTEINLKTHTSISGLELDSFIITTTTNAASTLVGGGSSVTCTRNIPMDLMYAQVQTMELPGTAISATAQSTT